MSNSKLNLSLSENDWQIILDSLSNTIFNEDIAEGARKRAKELFLKLQKEIPKTTEAFTNVTTEAAERDPKNDRGIY